MEKKMMYKSFFICMITALIFAAVNIALSSWYKTYYSDVNLLKLNINNLFMILVSGIVGTIAALKLNIPLWWHWDEELPNNKKLLKLIILGLAVICTNLLLNYLNSLNGHNWIQFSSAKESILISLRAGIYEEMIYRFLYFSLITFIMDKMLHSRKKALVIGALISSILWGFMHSGSPLIPFLLGLPICCIYYSYGLLPVIIVHFLADAIPFTLFFVK